MDLRRAIKVEHAALSAQETGLACRLLAFGFLLTGLLCALTSMDLFAHRSELPRWFPPLFLAGTVALLALIAFYVASLLAMPSSVQLRRGAGACVTWILLPISFVCTASVHQFYPFRVDLLDDNLALSAIIRFNFVLNLGSIAITALLAAIYQFGWRRFAFWSLLVLAGLLLIPNDDCNNAFNSRWIEWIGASPLMFIPNVLAILFAAGGLLGVRPNMALVATLAICVSTLGLGLGHISRVIW
jgi:hypothetical protein